MDYDQMYVTSDGSFVTSDGRNAPVVIDRRRVPRPVPTTTLQPAAPVAAVPMIAPAAPQYQYAPAWAQPMWAQQNWAQRGWGNAPGYVYPPPTTNLGSILGGFGDLASLASIASQIFAAFLPLPAAPTPQDNSEDSASDAAVNSSNLIRYQNALAQFAKRDQQILTIGSVLKELLKRPGYAAVGG